MFLTDAEIHLPSQTLDSLSPDKPREDMSSCWASRGSCHVWFECLFLVSMNHGDELSTSLQVLSRRATWICHSINTNKDCSLTLDILSTCCQVVQQVVYNWLVYCWLICQCFSRKSDYSFTLNTRKYWRKAFRVQCDIFRSLKDIAFLFTIVIDGFRVSGPFDFWFWELASPSFLSDTYFSVIVEPNGKPNPASRLVP